MATYYHYYGQSLLYEAKANSDLFGDSVEGLKKEEPEEEEEYEEEEYEEEEEEGEGEEEKNVDNASGEKATVEDADEEKATVEDANEEKATVEDADEEKGQTEEGQGEENEIEDLELAWQMLEVARNLASKDPNQKSLLSNIYISLGELNLENELIDESIEEYKKAIALREELGSLRGQAEGHFLISLSLEAQNKNDEAIASLETARKLLIVENEKNGKSEDIEAMIKDIDDKIECIQDVFTEAETDPFQLSGFGQSKLNSNDESELNILAPRRKVSSQEVESEWKENKEGEGDIAYPPTKKVKPNEEE